MSEHRLEVAELRRNGWSFAARADSLRAARADVRWWPASLPGSGYDDAAAPRPKPARRRVRRGRIQFVRAEARA
ncbi:MAG TPA: hypothetical protein VJ850_03595 [Candidatus Limnocylindrales bacterium]|nr:hypothetical protein [Candidatus Limnocylindrales bacterium]